MSFKYSILCYNFNNYDVFNEPDEIDPECEYIYVTDNSMLTSSKFKIIVDDTPTTSVFDKCYNVRFNLFKYCTTPVCIYMDASIKIFKSLRFLYDAFINSNADIGLNIHPTRTKLVEEYIAWCIERDYPIESAVKCLNFIKSTNYDFDFNGLYQGTFRICKNTELNRNIDTITLNILQQLSENGKIERIDQTIYSYVVNKYFKHVKIFPMSTKLIQSNVMQKYSHLYHQPENVKYIFNNGFVLNKLTPLYPC